MTILNEDEVEQYRGLRLSDLELVSGMGIAIITLKRLQLKENELILEGGSGLPYYLACQHHIKWRAINDLGEELGVGRSPLVSIFDYYGIPRLSPSEAQTRSIKERGPPTKRFKGIRKKHEKFNNGLLASQERKKIIREYDKIVINRYVDHWEELVDPVSEITGIEQEAVRSYLGKYFRKKN